MPEGDSVTTNFEMTLRPPGVYDPEKQLSGFQIIDLKNRFLNNPELIEKVAAHISSNLMKKIRERDANWFDTEEEWHDFEDGTKRSWTEGLAFVVEIPGDEWPQYLSPAATFAEALEEVVGLSES